VSGRWFLVKTRREWAEQVSEALDDIRAANGGTDPETVRETYDADPEAFARMIEGIVALGADVSPDLLDLAGMHDIGDLI